MFKVTGWLAICLAAALTVGTATCGRAYAQSGNESEIISLFKDGIRNYEEGDFANAKDAFDKVLALRPGSEAALLMRENSEIGQLAEMAADRELGPAASKILTMMREAVREKKRDVSNIEALITEFRSPDLMTYGTASVDLAGHGPYAVPYLLPLLALEGPDNQRILARTKMALSKMHRDVCLPLIEALAEDDPLLRARLVAILGQLGDRRAVPALLAQWQEPVVAPVVAEALIDALLKITGERPDDLGTAVSRYDELIVAYITEQVDEVGYLYGDDGEIWSWNPDAETFDQKLTYKLVPNYLYYRLMGAKLAVDGLDLAPAHERLQSLLVVSLARSLTLCELFSSKERLSAVGINNVSDAIRKDAAQRADAIKARLPVLVALCEPAVVGEALEMALELGDAASSLYLVDMLAGKVGLESTGAGRSFVEALDSGDKDVRYKAAIEALKASPSGAFGGEEKIMAVISSALRLASAKNALLVFDDLQARNTLNSLLPQKGIVSVACSADVGEVAERLNLEPAIDIVFLSGNVSPQTFGSVLVRLKNDIRTRDLPLYAVIDSKTQSVDVEGFEGISGVLSTDDLRMEKLGPILDQQVLAVSVTPLTEQKEATVMDAVEAVRGIDPATTGYPLAMLEPALIHALRGYGEAVHSACTDALGRFGSGAALEPLGKLVADESSSNDLKIAACLAITSVARRTGERASDAVIETLEAALSSDVEELKVAAAEALGAMVLPAEGWLELFREHAAPSF